MDFRFELIHHPQAAEDFRQSEGYFAEIDKDLAELFRSDFKVVLRGIAAGRFKGQLLAVGQAIRWVKLAHFSHKVFFEPDGTARLIVLGVISGRRHPTRIRLLLGRRLRA